MKEFKELEFNKNPNLTDGKNPIDKALADLEIKLHNASSDEEKDKIRDERGRLIFERSKNLRNANLN